MRVCMYLEGGFWVVDIEIVAGHWFDSLMVCRRDGDVESFVTQECKGEMFAHSESPK